MYTTDYQERSTIITLDIVIMKVEKMRVTVAVSYLEMKRFMRKIDNGDLVNVNIVDYSALSLFLKCNPLCNSKISR